MNFAKTFIPKITQAQNTKITYTKMNTVFIYISQREIVLWILIMKSIIALSVVESWCKNETSKRMVYLRQVWERDKSRSVVYEINHTKWHIKYYLRFM